MKYSINNFIKNRPKTKIVCTIGPSPGEIEILKKLIKEGMSVARLNLSHGETKEHIRYVENCRKAAEELKVPLGIFPKFYIFRTFIHPEVGQIKFWDGLESILVILGYMV